MAVATIGPERLAANFTSAAWVDHYGQALSPGFTGPRLSSWPWEGRRHSGPEAHSARLRGGLGIGGHGPEVGPQEFGGLNQSLEPMETAQHRFSGPWAFGGLRLQAQRCIQVEGSAPDVDFLKDIIYMYACFQASRRPDHDRTHHRVAHHDPWEGVLLLPALVLWA